MKINPLQSRNDKIQFSIFFFIRFSGRKYNVRGVIKTRLASFSPSIKRYTVYIKNYIARLSIIFLFVAHFFKSISCIILSANTLRRYNIYVYTQLRREPPHYFRIRYIYTPTSVHRCCVGVMSPCNNEA